MSTAADLEAETRQTIDELLRERMREDGVPGLSLVVVDGEDVSYATGYGSRDLASNEPATAETVYGIGSVSKSFASLAVLQLVDRGRLSVEDSVTEHLDVDVPEEVTLHHLLTHTSGYPSLAASEALIARQMEIGEAGVPLGSMDDVYAHIEGAREEIAGEPGERWAYCNSGYTLLGAVVEAVTGLGYSEYVEREILGPLEMERSTFDRETFESFEDRMTPYFPDPDGGGGDANASADGRDRNLTDFPLPIREQSAAAGGLLAPVSDLANYVRLHLSGGEFEGRRLVSGETLERAYGAYADTPSGPYGYGWRTRDVAGHELIGHGGSIAVSTAYLGFSPEEHVGFALLANAGPGYGLAELGKGVFAALVGEDPETLPFFEQKRRFEELTGEYETYRGIKRGTVQAEGGTLRLRVGGPISGGEWTTLIPRDVSEGEYYTLTAAGEEQEVRFVRDGGDLSLYVDRWRLHKQ